MILSVASYTLHPSFAVLISGCAGVQSDGSLFSDADNGFCFSTATPNCSNRKKRRGGALPRRAERPRNSRADASSLKLRANRRNA
jgi:hypothetical protein